jgi:peptidyl-prolyl cis-trans isomerase NIMA-interacting 1
MSSMTRCRRSRQEDQARMSRDFFPKLAHDRSDCSSFSKNGDLGFFERGVMQCPFEDAALALQAGQMSSLVSTESDGYH